MCSEGGDSGYSYEGGDIGENNETPDANEDLMDNNSLQEDADLLESEPLQEDEDLMESEPLQEDEDLTESEPLQENEKQGEQEAAENETTEVDERTRAEINEKSEYSPEVNEHIRSVEELEVYQKAGLKEQIVDGRTCLIREDIDMDYVDEESGMTNRELKEKGRAPFDAKTGERIELHHIGQDYDSPLAELTADSEHGGENFAKLHTSESDSWRNDSKLNNHYNNVQRPSHWKARA